MLETIVSSLGFVETEALTTTRTRLVEAIKAGNTAEGPRFWSQYEELAGVKIAALPDNDGAIDRARLGLTLMRASIWQAADELVQYLRELFEAHKQAENQGLNDIMETLSQLITPYAGHGEYFQALGRYNTAIEHYLSDPETAAPTEKQRGLRHLRLAECYRALLQKNPEDEDLKALLDASLKSASAHLNGLTEYSKVQQLLDEVGQEQSG